MANSKLTKEQISEIFKRVVGRDPTHNDYPAIVGLSNMDMTVEKIEEFFAPLKVHVEVNEMPVLAPPEPIPAPVQVKPAPIPAPVPVKLAPTVEPKPEVKHVTAAPVSVPAPAKTEQAPVRHKNISEMLGIPYVNDKPQKPSHLFDDDKTPVDLPKEVHYHPVDKKVEKPAQNATIPGKKGKNRKG